MELFDKFDQIVYKNNQLTNILRRVKPIRSIINRIDVFYDYVIKEGERADTIAFDYYGSSTYTWLIYIANNILDPYYQWPLSHNQMIDFLTNKYGDYYQTQIDIAFYRNDSKSFTVSQTTIDNWSVEQRIGWYAVTVYQNEFEINENKRKIKLVSNRYLDQINQQVDALFK